MATVKIRFRPSTVSGKGRHLILSGDPSADVPTDKSGYRIFAGEWDSKTGRILLPSLSSPRYTFLVSLKTELQWELENLRRMVEESETATGNVSLDEIAANFQPCTDTPDSVFNFIHEQAAQEKVGKVRSGETYRRCSTASCASVRA